MIRKPLELLIFAVSVPLNFTGEEFQYMLMDDRWLAFYTRSRAEKSIYTRLHGMGIDCCVPIHKVVRQWSDRRKQVEEPLILGYIFARPQGRQYFDVLNTPGVVRCVMYCGQPARIPHVQIEMLQRLVDENWEVEQSAGPFQPGEKVRFIRGPLLGITGELVEVAGKHKVILRLDHIEHSLLVTVHPAQLERVTA